MKRYTVFLIGFVFLFALTTIAAAEQPRTAKDVSAKENVVKKRQKTGKVLKISDTRLTITFKKKGVQEQDTMEFVLSSPQKLSIGEKVTVFFVEKNGVKEATRIKIKEPKETKKKSSS
ncbi:MAG: hypothetical protein LBV07_00065 [Syntrophobacterales bacterium]|jgi:Tfp pilus assembly protein FimT|nr:hypothetical protein [Syntrophobacterales bacterium]